jgi:carbonic anhydrase
LSPSRWSEMHPTCNGVNQSPIDFDSTRVFSLVAKPLRFEDYNLKPTEIAYRNTGHGFAARFAFADEVVRTISAGEDVFMFDHAHEYWPIEYTIDGEAFDAEVHLVHWNKLCSMHELSGVR